MAMSFPKLVIASDLTPNSDIVEDGVNGFLFKCMDEKNLADKIDILFSENYNPSVILENAIKSINDKNSPLIIGKMFHEVMATNQ